MSFIAAVSLEDEQEGFMALLVDSVSHCMWFEEHINIYTVYNFLSLVFLLCQAAAWIVLGIFSLIRFQADFLLVVGVCLSLSLANIIGFTKCRKGRFMNDYILTSIRHTYLYNP